MSRHDPSPLAPLVRKLCRWGPLTDEDEQAIFALPHSVRKLDAGHHIVREGDTPTHSCLLTSGFAFREKTVGDGSRQIMAIHLPGDMVDLQNSLLGVADHGVQALSAIEVAFIPREAMIDLAFDRPRVGKVLWYDTLVDASIHREWMANMGRRDARTALAHLLCEFGLRLEAAGLGSTTGYQLPMSQEQLADCLGLTSVHISRTLKVLRENGLAQHNGRAVIIDDWDRLAEAGDFNAMYLHLSDQEQRSTTLR